MKNYIFSISLISIWIYISYIIFFSSLTDNPISERDNESIQFALLPQGWSFFTRNPKEEVLMVYKLVGNKVSSSVIKPNGSPEYWFGIKRTPRLISIDLGGLSGELSGLEWHEIDSFNKNNQIDYNKMDTIYSESEILSGSYLFVKQKPKPWAWSDLTKFDMPAKILKVHVEN